MEPKYVSIKSAVEEYVKRQSKADFHAEVLKASQYYANVIMTEEGEIVITEDAEVVSIETIIK